MSSLIGAISAIAHAINATRIGIIEPIYIELQLACSTCKVSVAGHAEIVVPIAIFACLVIWIIECLPNALLAICLIGTAQASC